MLYGLRFWRSHNLARFSQNGTGDASFSSPRNTRRDNIGSNACGIWSQVQNPQTRSCRPILMKTQRVLIVVLSLLVVLLAIVAYRKKPDEVAATAWHTNTVEKWYTNTVEKWLTNNTEVSVTKTILQPITNEIIKEVPAKLSPAERLAAIVGFKSLNAPVLDPGSDALYKVSPLAVEVYVDPGTASQLGVDTDAIKKKIEAALGARSIPVAGDSPHRLSLGLNARWRNGDPHVALLLGELDLKETASIERQKDIVKCSGVVWSTTSSKLIRTSNMPEELDNSIQEPIDEFCKQYLKAKEKEKEIESRVPPVSPELLSEAK
jgi:hypothetical protein